MLESTHSISAEILRRGREVVRVETKALQELEARLDENFVAACNAILNVERQLVVTGMGKSGHIARKIAATFAATGTPAIFVHPGEAAHGDLGMLAPGDCLMVLSNSGNTPELRSIISFARRLKIPVIGIASGRNSHVIERADVPIPLPSVREACAANVAPTTSTTMQLALGDALAMSVMDQRRISQEYLRTLHPAGAIGIALTPVRELMHFASASPLVGKEARMADALSAMTSGRFGVAGVLDDAGHLIGIITDGDVRRHFEVLPTALARDVMTTAPKVIGADMLAGDALHFLNEHKITVAFVVETPDAWPLLPLGIIHIHDLLRLGLG